MHLIKQLLSLYRFDVFSITLMAGICGHYMSFNYLSLPIFTKTLFISGFLYNFVYTLNSITDIKEDQINNPHRPLASGALSVRIAVIYLISITLLSICGSILLFDGNAIILALLVLAIGAIYSLPPFALKNIPFIASFVTGWGIAHPLLIMGNHSIRFFAISFIFFASGVTLLKDLSDIEGDRAAGRKVITDIVSIKTICLISSGLITICAIMTILLGHYIIAIAPIIGITSILYYMNTIKKYEKIIYKKLVRNVGISLLIVTILTILN